MGVREAVNSKKSVGIAISSLFFLTAAAILIYTQLPQHRLKGDKAYFTDDDGQTWFLDSVFLTPPFDHNGKTSVRVMLYSYDHGNKTFCAYLMRFTADAKKRLDNAVAEAAKEGKPPSSVGLFSDKSISTSGLEVKSAGPGHSWFLKGSVEGLDVINQGLAIHADDTSDLVIAE